MPETTRSIFQTIAQLSSRAGANVQPSVRDCFLWLDEKGLTRTANTYQPDPSRDPANLLAAGNPIQLGIPSHRTARKTKADLATLKKHHEAQPPPLPEASLNQLWTELRHPETAIRTLDLRRLPPDFLAFYRPFHFSPFDEWGIYLMVDKLLAHCEFLFASFRGHLAAFNLQTLIGCVLFEVFHHEFFHHLTECAAATFEIASAGFGPPKPLYLAYWNGAFQTNPSIGPHPDHPLEEALANAYAYNSFSFLSRTQIGFKLVWVKLYQKILEKCWHLEPPGYSSAGTYINGGYVSGAAQLLAMLLPSPDLDPASLMLLAKTVMPSGNSAFLQKPDVPTYLVGDPAALARFTKLVPASIETYTTLFWLGDTSHIDKYLKKRKDDEALQKQTDRAKASMRS